MTLQTGEHRTISSTHPFPSFGDAELAGLAPDDIARPLRRVGILGAGEAGMDLVRRLLEADIPVTVYDLARATIDTAGAALRSDYQDAVSDGALTAPQRDRRVALLAATVNLHHLKDCDVIVDTLCADTAVKDGLFRRLNELARPDAVVVTCTADASHAAVLTRFPENVLAMRPADGAGGQWELVPAKATSGRALALARRIADPLGH